MTELNLTGLNATLTAHVTFMIALARTHHDRAGLAREFSRLISELIASTEDPLVSGVLQSFEESARRAIDASTPPTQG